jgi:hypothetical protein
MARFQALTNNVLDAELEMLRKRLGLERSQKADLLREISDLAAWVVRQAEQGREIEARKGSAVEPLTHPALERLRAHRAKNVGESLALDDREVERLAEILDRPFDPPPALRAALVNLASSTRRPPKLRWKKKSVAA